MARSTNNTESLSVCSPGYGDACTSKSLESCVSAEELGSISSKSEV